MVCHLVFLHLGSLLQAFDLRLVVLDDFVLLEQLAVLFMNKIVIGDEVAVQFLKHGLHHVG